MTHPSEVIGRRIGAGFIDVFALFLLLVVLGVALGEDEVGDGNASITLEGAEALLYFALWLAYYFVPEALWGATLGKRLVGLVVVDRREPRRAAGRSPSGRCCASSTCSRCCTSLG